MKIEFVKETKPDGTPEKANVRRGFDVKE